MALIKSHGTAYRAAQAINEYFDSVGISYQIGISTIEQMLKQGKGKPAMVALVRLVLCVSMRAIKSTQR